MFYLIAVFMISENRFLICDNPGNFSFSQWVVGTVGWEGELSIGSEMVALGKSLVFLCSCHSLYTGVCMYKHIIFTHFIVCSFKLFLVTMFSVLV